MTVSQSLEPLKRTSIARNLVAVFAALFTGLLASPAAALITLGTGNNPVPDNNWPAGSLDLVNLKMRVGWWEGPPFGGGEYNFQYRGAAAAFQRALDSFAKIKAPKLELFVHDGGPAESPFFKDAKDPKSGDPYDWSFTVWNPQSWNHLYNNPESQFLAEDPSGRFRETVVPPRLDVFVGGNKGIDFSKIKVPAGVRVTDERADANGFAGGSAVTGDVFDMVTSKPVAGAMIAIARPKSENHWEQVATAAADADAHFELKGVPKGSFGLLAAANGYAPRLLDFAEFRGNTFKHFSAQLAPAATLAGTALDTEGKPIAGTNVRAVAVTGVDGRGYILPRGGQAKTDDKGKFRLTGLPRGGHLLLFADAAHYAALDVLKLHSISEEGRSPASPGS